MLKLSIIRSFFRYFSIFYQYTGNKLFLFILSVFMIGIADGLGISAVIPLLNISMTKTISNDKISLFFNNIYNYFNTEITLGSILILITALFFLKNIFVFFQSAIQANISTWLLEKICKGLLRQYEAMKFSYYRGTNIGYLNNVINNEATRLKSSFKEFSEFISIACKGVVYSLISLAINLKLSIIVISLGLFLYVIYVGIRRKTRKLSLLHSQFNAESQQWLIQFIQYFKYIKATSGSEKLVSKLFEIFNKIRKITFQSAMLQGFTKSSLEFIVVSILCFFFYYLTKIENQPVSEVIIPLVLANRILSFTTAMQKTWQNFLSLSGGIAVVENARAQLDQHLEKDNGIVLKEFEKDIIFKKVNLEFNGNKVINDVDLLITKCKCIGIAGESGSGKTTLMDLLSGLLRPSSGKLIIDSIDYNDLNLKQLRSKIGYITQEPTIFNDTIANNISFWNCDSTDPLCRNKIEQSAMASHCWEFIEKAEKGIDEILGDKGIRLSGGQRQRIAIAREIFRDVDILIFDEATSSLDSYSERLIMKSIENLLGRKTIILIAHRLSTLKFCDIIYVVKNGFIVENGSWEKLMNNENSVFSKMCKEQGFHI